MSSKQSSSMEFCRLMARTLYLERSMASFNGSVTLAMLTSIEDTENEIGKWKRNLSVDEVLRD